VAAAAAREAGLGAVGAWGVGAAWGERAAAANGSECEKKKKQGPRCNCLFNYFNAGVQGWLRLLIFHSFLFFSLSRSSHPSVAVRWVVRDAERYERVCDPCFAALVAPRGSNTSAAILSPSMTPSRIPTRSQLLSNQAATSSSGSGGRGSGKSIMTAWQDMYAQIDDDDEEGDQALDARVHGRVPGIRTSVDFMSHSSSSSSGGGSSNDNTTSWAILATARELEEAEDDEENEAEVEATRATAEGDEAAGRAGVAVAAAVAGATGAAASGRLAFQSNSGRSGGAAGRGEGSGTHADDDEDDDEAAGRYVLGPPQNHESIHPSSNSADAQQDQVLRPRLLPLWATSDEKDDDTVEHAVDDVTDDATIVRNDGSCYLENEETPNHQQIHSELPPDKEVDAWSLPSWLSDWVGVGNGALVYENSQRKA